MTDRVVRRLDAASEAEVHFSECLHSPNIVLLGDPGAGKSHLFSAFAPSNGLLRARDFLNTRLDALRGQSTPFIDALDEKRSSRTDVTPIDLIVGRLMELKPSNLRIACRAADWLGTSDLGAFRPYFASKGGVSVLALQALTDVECADVLTSLGCLVRIPAKPDSQSGDDGQRRSEATQAGQLGIRVSVMVQGGPCFAHGFAGGELDAVSVVNEPVEDGIGDAPAAQILVPVAHG